MKLLASSTVEKFSDLMSVHQQNIVLNAASLLMLAALTAIQCHWLRSQ